VLRSVKYGLYGAIAAGLVAAPIAWASADKAVRLVVDGHPRTVHTTAADVSGALGSAGYRLTAHDLVAPGAHSMIHDGSRIVLQRGRQLRLDINGQRRVIWTTAPTVAVALDQLGYSTTDFVSVSRAQRLPLRPTDVVIRTPQLVTVRFDGQQEMVRTTAGTVGQLLTDLGITVHGADRLSAGQGSPLHENQVIRLQRVTHQRRVRAVTLPAPVVRHPDASLYRGSTVVVASGRPGRARMTYSIVFVDGTRVGRTVLARDVLRNPEPRVLKVGTKRLAYDGTPASAQAIARKMLPKFGFDSGQMDCLIQMWDRESGWNPHAANSGSGAYGIPQALPGSKMASAGSDWADNPVTQITWGLGYIKERYGTPCGAWAFWQQGDYY
jgi:uncharacterized protein YabE (DUF348 family)